MVKQDTQMKHYYEECPDNQDGPVPYYITPWFIKQTNCPWCLHKWIIVYDRYYRKNPEGAIDWMISNLQHES